MSVSSDLAWAFTEPEATVEVVFGAVTTRGFFDEHDQDATSLDGSVTGRVRSLVIRTGTLPGVKPDSDLVVGGVNHVVHDVRKIGDGAMTQLFLAEA